MLSCSNKSPESRCVSLCSMHKGLPTYGRQQQLALTASVALFLSFSRLVKNCTHTHTHIHHQNYYTTNCLASSAVWRNRMLWVVESEPLSSSVPPVTCNANGKWRLSAQCTQLGKILCRIRNNCDLQAVSTTTVSRVRM